MFHVKAADNVSYSHTC